MRALVRAHPFLFYYVLSLVIAGLVTVVGVTWGANSPSADPLSYWHYAQAHHMVLNAISIAAFGLTTGGPFVFLVFLFGGAPSISALITSAIGWGKAGLVRLLSRFKPWRRGVTAREGLRVYAILIGIYLLMFAFFMWFTSAYGKPADKDYVWTVLGGSAVTAFFIALLSLFADEGASFEELGWRGFAYPYLQQKFRVPLVAAIVLGVLWWAWHLPREIPGIFAGHNLIGEPFHLGQWILGEAAFCSYTIVLSIVIAYCFNLTGGSVWPAIFIHGGTNAWSKIGAMAAAYNATHWPIDLREVVLLVFMVPILIFAGPRLGLRPDADGIDPTSA